MKQLITILLMTLSLTAWTQVEVGDVISDKYKGKIEKLQDPRAKLKKYRKFYSKDSVRQVKQLEKIAESRIDSITDVLKSKRSLPKLEQGADITSLSDKQEVNQKITSEVEQRIKEQDSFEGLEESQTVLKSHQEEFAKHTEELNELKLDSAGIARYKGQVKGQAKKATSELDQGGYADELMDLKLDSAQVAGYKEQGKEKAKSTASEAEQKAAEKAGVGVLNEQQESLESIKNTPEEYKKLAEEYKDKGQLKEKAKKASREKAAEFFIAHQAKLLAQQKKMGLLKNKYASVLNSNDLSTAVKVNSLKGKSFRERLILGGDFQMVEAKPLILAASPIIGYRFDKRLSIGLGANLRISQKQDNSPTQTTGKDGRNAQGGKAFIQYVLVKSFHSVAEYEMTHTQVPNNKLDVITKEWVPGILVGIGKKFPIHAKVNASVSVLYNLMYDAAKSPYTSPFVFRFGFQLSEVALLKK